jgi:hypothetical protein
VGSASMLLAKSVPLRKGPPTGGPRCPLAASARRVAERTARRWRPPACGRPRLARAGGACREREPRQGRSGVGRGRRPRGAGAGSPRWATRCLIGMRGARFHVRDVARGPGAGIARRTPQRSPTSRRPAVRRTVRNVRPRGEDPPITRESMTRYRDAIYKKQKEGKTTPTTASDQRRQPLRIC